MYNIDLSCNCTHPIRTTLITTFEVRSNNNEYKDRYSLLETGVRGTFPYKGPYVDELGLLMVTEKS